MTAAGWTFESLAAADRGQFEEVLLAGEAPDYGQLEGYTYCGWNHGWWGRLASEKFKKGFRGKGQRILGYNELCRQDSQGFRGEWNLNLKDAQPRRVGYFRVGLIRDEPPRRLYRPYQHAGLLDYNVDLNTWRNLPFRVIRDIVVLPNPGDHSLLLGKAYLQLAFVHLFYCYFLLGHRRELEHEPW